MSHSCASPLCSVVIPPPAPGKWRRTKRRFCCNACKRDSWALKRAAEVCNQLGVVTFFMILFPKNEGGSHA